MHGLTLDELVKIYQRRNKRKRAANAPGLEYLRLRIASMSREAYAKFRAGFRD
jgi:hypothetical protein